MADELTLRCNLSFEKLGTIHELLFGPTDLDVSGNRPQRGRQNVGTTEEALLLGDAGVGGYLMAINRDATNYVEIRPGSGLADLVKLMPGDVCLFRLAADCTPYVIANTAACDLDYVVIPA